MTSYPAGLSLLSVTTALAIIVAIGLAGSVSLKAKGLEDRDIQRQQDLQTIAKAQEFFFDRYNRYANMSELLAYKFIDKPLVDPVTAAPYKIFRTETKDEWCVYAQLEKGINPYIVQDEVGFVSTSRQPINLATCKVNH